MDKEEEKKILNRKKNIECKRILRIKRRQSGLCDCGGERIPGLKQCEKCILMGHSQRQFGTKKHWKKLKELFDKQTHRCPYTGIILKIGITASIDHIIPISRGGSNTIKNLQWVHKRINDMKSSCTTKEFLTVCAHVANRQQKGLINVESGEMMKNGLLLKRKRKRNKGSNWEVQETTRSKYDRC